MGVGCSGRLKLRRIGVFCIEKQAIGGIHIFKNTRLRCCIGFHGVMALQMIRRDIQNHRRFRLEIMNKFQLETGNFCRNEAIRRYQFRLPRKGNPQISGQSKGVSPMAQHTSQKGGGGSLAIGAGNRQNGRFRHAVSQLHFTQYRNPSMEGFLYDRIFRRDGRRNHQGIHTVQKFAGLGPEAEFRPLLYQSGFFFFITYIVFQIRNQNLRVMAQKHMSSPQSADTGAEDQYIFHGNTSWQKESR